MSTLKSILNLWILGLLIFTSIQSPISPALGAPITEDSSRLQSREGLAEGTTCSDGIDNDTDGLIDLLVKSTLNNAGFKNNYVVAVNGGWRMFT